MEFAVILFIVVILFNVINSLVKQDKARQGSPPGRTGFSGHGTVEPPWAGEGKSLEWVEEPADGGGEAVPLQHVAEKAPAAEKAAVATSLMDMLRKKDQLVAGFIFHEILAPPRGLRRR